MVGNSLVEDLISDRRSNIRANFEKAFRDAVDEKQFNALFDQMIEAYGKPLDFELKRSETGTREYDNNQTKTTRKLWYAAHTTKYQKGSHFLIVEVVPDGDKLAVASFAVVQVGVGIPLDLK